MEMISLEQELKGTFIPEEESFRENSGWKESGSSLFHYGKK